VDEPRPIEAASPAEALAEGPPDYVGLWAAEPRLCEQAFWTISRRSLTTDAGGRCALSAGQATANGWAARATCDTGASGSILLNTAGPASTLVVSGAPWPAPITLIRCPGNPQAEGAARDPHAALDAALAIDALLANRDGDVSVTRGPSNALVSAVWRRGGEIVKIVEPVVGGEHAGGERAYYFRPGETEPFLVSDATGSYAFGEGRLVTAFNPRGAIVSELRTREESRTERRLLRQARTLRAVAEELGDER
jgi:hypothetical protein